MVLMLPFLTNVITISSMARLTSVYHSHQLLEKSSDCTKEILEAKNNYILKMTTNLQDP